MNGNLDVGERFLQLATVLDPRFKEKFLKDKEKVMDKIIHELIADDKIE